LDFGDEPGDEKTESQTLRLLRSVSFGNDTQIMSKLKMLKNDLISSEKKNISPDKDGISVSTKSSDTNSQRRSTSLESNSSLEAKINRYYEPQSQSQSRDTSVEKSISREISPDESHETYQDTIRPQNPPKSPSIQIRGNKHLSREVTPCSPSRTPITQDDPLGALSEPCSPDGKDNETVSVKSANYIQPPINRDSPKRTCSEGHIGGMNERTLMGPPVELPKGFHRSSTLPNYDISIGDRAGPHSSSSEEKLAAGMGVGGGSLGGGVSGLTVFNSSLKNSFT
jgi:hypothetical protein